MGAPNPKSLDMKEETRWRRFSLCNVVSGSSVSLEERGNTTPQRCFCMFSFARDSAGIQVLQVATWNSRHVRITASFPMGEWDPDEVRAAVMAAVAASRYDLDTGSHIQNTAWVRDTFLEFSSCRQNRGFNSRPCRALKEAQNAIGSAYGIFNDHSFKSAVESIRECFRKYQGRLSEEQVVEWFREATVAHVLSQ